MWQHLTTKAKVDTIAMEGSREVLVIRKPLPTRMFGDD